MPELSAPMVLLEGLTKTRTQSESVFELRVSRFSVRPGQVVAVTGESGCGKSTLLDILALVMGPTRVDRFELQNNGLQHDLARLWDNDEEATLSALRRDTFGYVLQTGGLLPFLNVRRNIILPGRIKGAPVSRNRLDTLAARLGLAGYLDRMPSSLSIGQRQRAAILRALAHSPRVVLADEPTAAVDKARARTIMDDMHALARDEGTAVVVVTHDTDLVATGVDATYTFDTNRVDDRTTRSVCRRVMEEGP